LGRWEELLTIQTAALCGEFISKIKNNEVKAAILHQQHTNAAKNICLSSDLITPRR